MYQNIIHTKTFQLFRIYQLGNGKRLFRTMDTCDMAFSVLITIKTKKYYNLIDVETHVHFKPNDIKLIFFY